MATRKLYPVLYTDRDIEDFRNDIWTMFDAFRGPLLTSGNFPGRMLSGGFTEFKVDVNEHGDEVMVVADLPGVEKQDINIRLLNPRSLEISTERKNETEGEEKGYYVRERTYGSMTRIVPLPAEVEEKDADANFKNGVLEIRLKKMKETKENKIEIK